MWAVDVIGSDPFTARLLGTTGILIMATALGWTAARVLDPAEASDGGSSEWWRRWESNPRPENASRRSLRA